MAETYRPPQGVRDEAKRALEWIAAGKAGAGFTDVGRKRAADLARGAALSSATVLRVYSYLLRHEVDKNGKGFSPGDEGYPSPGRVAYAAWGGDPALAWSSKIRDQLADRSALLEESMETREIIAQEPAQIEPVMSGVDSDYLAHKVMAADAAMDAAQTLLQAYGDSDPNISQAYHLICAADCALSDVIESLGFSDDDDEMPELEPAVAPVEAVEVDMMAMYSADPDVEARRSLIESAEKRTYLTEMRAERSADGIRMVGYAAMWDQEADGLPFREVIKRGAFSRSLDRGDDVFLLVNHDTDQLPLARRDAGTLTVIEDETGLRMEADLDPMNPRAAELASALERGDVDKMSFAFRVGENGSAKNDEGVRELRNLDLFEVSVVTWPAYSATTVGLREAAPADDLALRARLLRAKLAQQDIH
jgi:HK97 family phage prohead protease